MSEDDHNHKQKVSEEEEHAKKQENVTEKKDGSSEANKLELEFDDEFNECRTPRSEEHKIPRAQSCPPAPRKRRRQEGEEEVFLHKRKLSGDHHPLQLQFFEKTLGGEEVVEALFESSPPPCVDNSRVSSSRSTKRRRPRSR